MSNPRKLQRRAELRTLRDEGAAAFSAGRHIQTVPRQYLGTTNRYAWEQGYRDAEAATAQEEEES